MTKITYLQNQTKKDSQRKQTYGYKEEVGGDKLGVWDTQYYV